MTSTTSSRTDLIERINDFSTRASARLINAIASHRASLAWAIPLLGIAAVATFLNFAGSPQQIDDEGTYTAQAYATTVFGQLSHYTYWYDHPPLGWIQIGAYDQLTGAFARYSVAVLAGREAVIVATVVSVGLLFVLARRLGISRAGSAVAGLIFALSPLAIQFHRTVYLDNVATPWLIGAFILALSRRRQLAGFAAAAVCFGIAVLSKETYLLALPFLAWTMIRSAKPSTRRYTLSVSASVLVLIGFSYVLLALIKGELFPRSGQVSLIGGITYQLGSRASSGSIFDPSSLINRTVAIWWSLDPVFIVIGLVASVAALRLRSFRPFAALVVFSVLIMFRPGGYLPVPYVIMLLPFAALMTAGMGDRAIATLRSARRVGVARPVRLAALALVLSCTVALAAAVPLWTVQLRGFLLSDLDAPVVSSEQWIDTNISHDARLIVDDSMWVDLVRDGWARQNVTWYYKMDTDPAVEKLSPQGWKDSDYVITTNSMRTFPDGFPQVQKAIDNSSVVASFGTGVTRVDIRRIDPAGSTAAKAAAGLAAISRTLAGDALAHNPGLALSSPERSMLESGQVDSRISLAIGTQLAVGPVVIGGFPMEPGEASAPRRQVIISTIDGAPAARGGSFTVATRNFISSLTGDYRPVTAAVSGNTLVLTYSSNPDVQLIN